MPSEADKPPETPKAIPVDLKNPLLAGFLGWLIPGLGHLYQGRKGKAVLYGVSILSLYLVGFVLGDGKIVLWRWINPMRDSENFQPWYLGQFWTGLVALPPLIQATLVYYGKETILNGFMAEPSSDVLNGLHQYGKLIDIGKIYTTIAGLLNLLAIFDAYEGPADGGLPPAPKVVAGPEIAVNPNDVAAEVGS